MEWKYKRIEIIYLTDEEEICITPYAAMSYVPRIGETLWIQGKLREELIEKDLPTVFKVEDVCYHVVSATEMNNVYDSVVLYVVRLGQEMMSVTNLENSVTGV